MTLVTSPPKAITEEELLRMSAGDQWFEVVHGEVAPVMAAGFLHAVVMSNVFSLLDHFAREHRLGHVFGDGLHYILDADAESIRGSRIPDVSFIRRGRIPKNFDYRRPFPGAPDLAVEVISPDESGQGVLEKVNDYLQAGTEEVWAVYPEAQIIHQYRRDDPRTIHVYKSDDRIDAGTLFPGLELRAQALFILPEETD